MHKIIDKRILMKIGNGLMSIRQMFRKYAGQIGYYACVVLVLAAVALAAERFRNGNAPAEQLIMPAVELAAPVQYEEKPLLELPEGLIMMKNYADQPEWNSVHRQWETHAAVDFVCADGEVLSFSDGIIRTVGKSGTYGGFVEVETEELLLRYCSIEPDARIIPGKKLKKDELIGVTNDSMPGESYMGVHLHLEVWKDTISEDIMALVGKNL